MPSVSLAKRKLLALDFLSFLFELKRRDDTRLSFDCVGAHHCLAEGRATRGKGPGPLIHLLELDRYVRGTGLVSSAGHCIPGPLFSILAFFIIKTIKERFTVFSRALYSSWKFFLYQNRSPSAHLIMLPSSLFPPSSVVT